MITHLKNLPCTQFFLAMDIAFNVAIILICIFAGGAA